MKIGILIFAAMTITAVAQTLYGLQDGIQFKLVYRKNSQWVADLTVITDDTPASLPGWTNDSPYLNGNSLRGGALEVPPFSMTIVPVDLWSNYASFTDNVEISVNHTTVKMYLRPPSVPEPSTALLSIGSLALFRRRRITKKGGRCE